MIESYWSTCTDPGAMLWWLTTGNSLEIKPRISDRQLRLFAAECVKAARGDIPNLEVPPTNYTPLLWASEWAAAWCHQPISMSQRADILRDIVGNPFRPVKIDTRYVADAINAWGDILSFHADCWPEEEFTYRPRYAACPSVLILARDIYDDRNFDRLPILADALEEAGCTDAAILNHCRGPGPHVRGCWVLDLLLGES